MDDEQDSRVTDFVRGKSSATEAKRLEADAAADPKLAAEIEFARKLKQAIGETADASDDGGSELGWARLSKAIDREVGAHPVAAAPAFWRYAALVLGAVALGQAAVLTTKIGARKEPTYVTASAGGASHGDQQHTIKITFAPDAKEGEIRALFLSVDADIVSGPSAAGVYEVRLEDADAKATAKEVFEQSSSLIKTISRD